MYSLRTLISGAQTGIDQFSLEVARECGFETGGTAPPGFQTEKGPKPEWAEYGVQEITSELQKGKTGKHFYNPRTEQNVINSDATLYYAADYESPGRYVTERFCAEHKKPFSVNLSTDDFLKFIKDNNVKVLNMAGNRASKLTEGQQIGFKTFLTGILLRIANERAV